jgi:hypothetical protein
LALAKNYAVLAKATKIIKVFLQLKLEAINLLKLDYIEQIEIKILSLMNLNFLMVSIEK